MLVVARMYATVYLNLKTISVEHKAVIWVKLATAYHTVISTACVDDVVTATSVCQVAGGATLRWPAWLGIRPW